MFRSDLQEAVDPSAAPDSDWFAARATLLRQFPWQNVSQLDIPVLKEAVLKPLLDFMDQLAMHTAQTSLTQQQHLLEVASTVTEVSVVRGRMEGS